MFAWIAYLNTVILCIQYVIYQNRALAEAPLCVWFMCQLAAAAEAEQRKGTPLRKCTNKDTFRYLITIWGIGIARRGLN